MNNVMKTISKVLKSLQIQRVEGKFFVDGRFDRGGEAGGKMKLLAGDWVPEWQPDGWISVGLRGAAAAHTHAL